VSRITPSKATARACSFTWAGGKLLRHFRQIGCGFPPMPEAYCNWQHGSCAAGLSDRGRRTATREDERFLRMQCATSQASCWRVTWHAHRGVDPKRCFRQWRAGRQAVMLRSETKIADLLLKSGRASVGLIRLPLMLAAAILLQHAVSMQTLAQTNSGDETYDPYAVTPAQKATIDRIAASPIDYRAI